MNVHELFPSKENGGSNVLLNKTTLGLELGFDRHTIKKWFDQGVLPSAITVGGMQYWTRGEIQRWLKHKQHIANGIDDGSLDPADYDEPSLLPDVEVKL